MITAKKVKSPIGRPKGLADLATEKIRQAIIDGRFGFGQAISETMLSEMYKISKTPIKCALTRLAGEGLVEIKPQKGSFVFSAKPDEVAQLADWRVLLETAALSLALANNRQTLLKALKTCVSKMQAAFEARDDKTYFNHDRAFHKNIVQYSGNRYLLNSYAACAGRMCAIFFHLSKKEPWKLVSGGGDHQTIIELLEQDKLEQAQKVLGDHIRRFLDRLD